MISILYVDDERDLLEIGKLYLEEDKGFSVDCVLSGSEALERLTAGHYDAVVSDYQMPKMNGIALLKTVRTTIGDIPFILFTGKGREDVVIEAINNGADFYLQKGGEPESQFAELAHKIRQAVTKKQTERSLHDSERRLSDIIDFLPDATFAIDRSGHVIAWNRVMKELTGRSAREMLGKGDYEYAIPFYGTRRPILIDLVFSPHDEIRKKYSFVRADKEILIAETVNATPKGIQRVLSGKAAPLFDYQGTVVGAIESIRDITDIKKTEQELRRSEEWFRNLIQNSSDVIRIIGRDGLITYSSPSTLRVTGFDPSEMIGKDPFDYVHPDDRDRMKQAFDEVVNRANSGIPTEFRILHADGHYVDVESIANNLLAIPEIDGIVVTTRPITERKRAEEALRERERTLRINDERLRMAQVIGQTGSWEYSLATNTIWGSEEGLRIFGFAAQAGDFPIEDIEACIQERDRVHQALVDLITSGKEYNIEYTINPADGSLPKVIHSVARLKRDTEGNPVRVLGVIQDVTEQNRVNDELSFKNAILSTQQEASPDGILIVDENGKILNYNRKFITLWNIPDEILASGLDEPVLQYVVGQLADKEAFLSRVRYLYEHKDEKSFEELYLRDGRVLERYSAPMLGEYGKYYGRVWYFRDISGRRQAEVEKSRFGRILDNSLNEIFIFDAETLRFIDVNQGARENLGYTLDELRMLTPLDIKPEYTLRDFETLIAPLRSGEKEEQVFTTVHKRKDGSRYPVEVHLQLSRTGISPVFFAIILDITERRQAEEALRQSEAKFRGMAERISDIVLVVDKDLSVTYASPSALKLTGKEASDILGKPLRIGNLSPAEQEKIHTAFLDNKALKTTGPVEITLRIPEHGSRVLEFHGVPIQERGVFQGVQLVAHDITGLRKAQDELRSAYEHLAANEEELRQNYNELHRHEEVLRESEEKFRSLVEHSLDGILITDFSGALLFANRAAGLIVDIPDPEAIVGKTNVLEFVAKEYQADVLEDFKKNSKGIDSYLVNYKLVTRTNREVWVECIGKKIPFRDTEAVLISMRDVTERKKAEEHIRESESKFATVFRSSPVALTLVSATDGIFIDVNDAFVRNTGYSREEVTGKTSEQLGLIPDDGDRQKLASAIRSRQEVCGMEISCRTKTGESRNCRFSSRIILMQAKPFILSTIEDNTERRRADEQLRESEERFRSLYTNMIEAVVLHELTYNEQGIPDDYRILEMNPAFEKHLGISRETVIGKTGREAFGVTEPPYFDIYTRVALTGKPEVFETYFPPLDKYFSISVYCPVKGHFATIFEDITDRKRAEEENWKAREILEGIINSIQVRVFWKDWNLNYLGCNVPFARDAGFETPAEVIGRDDFAMGWREMAERYRSDDRAVIESAIPKMFIEEPQRTPSGETIMLLTTKIPLRDAGGKVIGVLGTYINITDRKKIEDTLRENRLKLGEAMDMAHLANWEYDVLSGMFTFDDRFYALYGTTADREGGYLMPAKVYAREFVHPDDRHLVGEEMTRALTTTDPNYTNRLEHRIIRRDGEIRHIVVSVEITKDAEGRTIKTHGANQDITDIKKAEEEVRKSEERFRSLIETTPGIIWEIDPKGTLTYVSPMVAKIMGYPPEELIGTMIIDLVQKQMRTVVASLMANFGSLTEGPIQPFEVLVRHRDGHDMVLEIRPSRVTSAEGTLIGFRGVAFDTTERKRAEEALKRANHQLHLLGSITRHDLLNKITVILGNLKIAEKKCTDSTQREHLTKIRSATSTIKSQIELTRIYQELGTQEPQWIELDTVMPFQQVPPGIRLGAEVGGIQVLADPMLERVFFNLLDNSVRHGGKVTEIRVSSHQSKGNLVVVWEDNGKGIAAGDKERVFERGFGENTGLGMFLAREILSLTGITIRETGSSGTGARFEITVPDGAYRTPGK
ncbi:MAG: PAS domain S-box protein [Methanoregula sp.]